MRNGVEEGSGRARGGVADEGRVAEEGEGGGVVAGVAREVQRREAARGGEPVRDSDLLGCTPPRLYIETARWEVMRKVS